MESLWLAKNKLPQFPCLEGDKKTDVLIIGGGLCGILCARELEKLGVDYILAEKDRICRKTSGNTTAKITSQHGLIYADIAKKYGMEAAYNYYAVNEKAIEEYAEICKEIDCGFERRDNFIYSRSSLKKLNDEMEVLSEISARARFMPSLSDLPFDVLGAIRFSSQAQFDAAAFVSAVAPKLNIFENSHVKGFDGKDFYGDRFKIKAEKTIVATHFPMFNKMGGYSLKLYQHRSYLLALNNAKNINGMYLDEDEKGFTFRNYGDYLIFGGGSHRTGKQGGAYEEIIRASKEFYPESTVEYSWASQDCMSLDSMPYIGRYSKSNPDIFVATGFNKWGMSLSMVSALILKDLIFGKESDYSTLFSPSRSVFHSQLAVNCAETLTNFLNLKKPRCPHLGCALNWNEQEHSWDCACHGSRFDEKGVLLDNPADGDLKRK